MIECKNCSKELTSKYQKSFCSQKCGSRYYINNRKTVSCPYCKKELTTRWNSHIKRCKESHEHRYSSTCDFGCDKPSKYFFKNGKACCSKSTGGCVDQRNTTNYSHKGNPAWNKDLDISDPRIKAGVEKAKKNGSYVITEERKKRLSFLAKQRGLGGYNRRGGRGKKGWYKGIWCDSSWELAFVIYHLDHNISVTRCTECREYSWNGAIRKYYPDFIVNNEIYEIKGYKTEQWLAKIKDHPDIICLYKNEMTKYIKYVIDAYERDYIKLYE